MLDVCRIVALIVALAFALRARSRVGIAATLVVAYVYTVEILDGMAARGAGDLTPLHGFMLLLIGPSGVPRVAAARWPLARLVADHPSAAHVFTAVCVAVPIGALSRRSAALRPETEEARRLDRAALQLALVLVLDLLLALLGISAGALARV